MTRRLPFILAAAFAALLWLPLVQQASRVFPACALSGVEPPPERPVAGWRAVLEGNFQSAFERWFDARMGLRAWLVRTDNQLNYSVFGRVRSSRGTRIILGRDRFLYDESYVRAYNRETSFPEARLAEESAKVKRLQELLAARGVAFLLVVAPSKVEVYPEHLPRGVLQPGREQRRTAGDVLGRLFVEMGVQHLNGHDLFLQWKAAEPYPLFSPGGVHWNYYGAARIVDLMLSRLEELSGRDFINLRCTGARMEPWVKGNDNDLGNLLNLWTDPFGKGLHAHPVLERDDRPPARGANLLFVGDSFALTLMELLEEESVCSRVDLLYYFKREYTYPGGESRPVAYTGGELLRELEGRDAVVIEVNEFWLPEIGWGFVDQMTDALAGEPGARAKSSPP